MVRIPVRQLTDDLSQIRARVVPISSRVRAERPIRTLGNFDFENLIQWLAARWPRPKAFNFGIGVNRRLAG
jgi:hypothetical protein